MPLVIRLPAVGACRGRIDSVIFLMWLVGIWSDLDESLKQEYRDYDEPLLKE